MFLGVEAALPMELKIDRDLPIPIRQQLKGLIEYSIACGEVSAGEPLPSVRDLAQQLGIAPMTVSQVYRDLKGQGLIETRAGAGTTVADSGAARLAGRAGLMTLHRRIDALIDEGLGLGLRASDLAALIHARLASRAGLGRRGSVAMVGVFPAATARYARLIAAQLGAAATVQPLTIEAIQRDPALQARAASADVVVTLVNRRREVASLLPGARVVAVRFVPSDETRAELAALPVRASLLLVARFAEFLPIMKAGVARFAPQAGLLHSAGSREAMLPFIAGSDAVIFASGTEDWLAGLGPETRTLEYTHVPDPADVERLIAPLVRAGAKTEGSVASA